jgi:hypothetical protein
MDTMNYINNSNNNSNIKNMNHWLGGKAMALHSIHNRLKATDCQREKRDTMTML